MRLLDARRLLDNQFTDKAINSADTKKRKWLMRVTIKDSLQCLKEVMALQLRQKKSCNRLRSSSC